MRLILFLAAFVLLTVGSAAAVPQLVAEGPERGRLAFTYRLNNQRDIFVIDFETKQVLQLTNSPAVDEYPTFSPDGTQIAFYSDRNGNTDIYVMNSDGSEPTQLTFSPGLDEDPDWSPDGTRIVFSSERLKKGSQNLFVMDANGENQTALTSTDKKYTVPRWSPRGHEIIYSTNAYWPGWDMMLLNLEDNSTELLTHGVRSFCRANWSPDGSMYAFSFGAGNDIDLYVQKIGEKSPQQITNQAGREYDPAWIDSRNILFAGELTRGKGDYQIFMLNLATKQVTQITQGPGAIRYLSYTRFSALPPKPTPESDAGEVGDSNNN